MCVHMCARMLAGQRRGEGGGSRKRALPPLVVATAAQTERRHTSGRAHTGSHGREEGVNMHTDGRDKDWMWRGAASSARVSLKTRCGVRGEREEGSGGTWKRLRARPPPSHLSSPRSKLLLRCVALLLLSFALPCCASPPSHVPPQKGNSRGCRTAGPASSA